MAILINGQDTLLIETQIDAALAEEHAHHITRWFGKKAVQGATDDWCITMDGNLDKPYKAISGVNIYGTDAGDTALLFGKTDIPIAGMLRGDFDEILITVNTADTVSILRLVWGTGATAADGLAAGIAAGQYSEFSFLKKSTDTVRIRAVFPALAIPITIGGLPVMVFMQFQAAGDNTYVQFFLGVHGYAF